MAKTPRARVAAPASPPAPAPAAESSIAAAPAVDTPAPAPDPFEEAVEEQPTGETPEILDPSDFDLVVDPDGMITLEMLTCLSGPEVCLSPTDTYRCDPQEACRLARAEFARQGQFQA